MNWEIQVAKRWSAGDLKPLVERDDQLHGISFSSGKIEIYLREIDFPLPLAKQMLFEILGTYFFCEGTNLIELKNNKFVLQANIISKFLRC